MATAIQLETAELAIQLAMPTVWAMMRDGRVTADDEHLHLGLGLRAENQLETLAQTSIGEPSAWEYDYQDIGVRKGIISARTGMASREVALMHPQLLVVEGLTPDTIYWGSWIDQNLIGYCSGTFPYIDEVISKITVAIWKGLIQGDVENRIINAEEAKATHF
jgi:hypothetical protein